MRNVILSRAKRSFKREMSFAKSIGFEGILIQIGSDIDSNSSIFLETIYNNKTIEEIAIDNGWDHDFLFIDFTTKKETIIQIADKVA